MRWRFIDCLWLSQVFTGGTNPGIVESNIGAGSCKGFRKKIIYDSYKMQIDIQIDLDNLFCFFSFWYIYFGGDVEKSLSIFSVERCLSVFLGDADLESFERFANSWIIRLVFF